MFRFLLGAATVILLVGAGIISESEIKEWTGGARDAIHNGLSKAAEATK